MLLKNSNIFIIGPKRVGKTSLAFNIIQQLLIPNETDIIVFTDSPKEYIWQNKSMQLKTRVQVYSSVQNNNGILQELTGKRDTILVFDNLQPKEIETSRLVYQSQTTNIFIGMNVLDLKPQLRARVDYFLVKSIDNQLEALYRTCSLSNVSFSQFKELYEEMTQEYNYMCINARTQSISTVENLLYDSLFHCKEQEL